MKNLVSGGKTKYTIGKKMTTALELQNTHSTSDAVTRASSNTKALSECIYGARHERYNSYPGFFLLCTVTGWL